MALADRIAGLDIPGRLVPPENWHVTVRFMAGVDDVAYERFLAGMGDVEDHGSFRISLDRFGAFPRPKRATVVWAGLGEGVAELSLLNELAEEAAVGAGVAPEERPYSPHLTLSRVRPPEDVRWLEEEDLDLGWRCDRLVVYRSRTGPGGARYEALETFALSPHG